jgi:hypothetical protein
MMSCPTPHIDLPGGFANITVSTDDDAQIRTRRDMEANMGVHVRSRRDAAEDDDQVVISEKEQNNERYGGDSGARGRMVKAEEPTWRD